MKPFILMILLASSTVWAQSRVRTVNPTVPAAPETLPCKENPQKFDTQASCALECPAIAKSHEDKPADIAKADCRRWRFAYEKELYWICVSPNCGFSYNKTVCPSPNEVTGFKSMQECEVAKKQIALTLVYTAKGKEDSWKCERDGLGMTYRVSSPECSAVLTH